MPAAFRTNHCLIRRQIPCLPAVNTHWVVTIDLKACRHEHTTATMVLLYICPPRQDKIPESANSCYGVGLSPGLNIVTLSMTQRHLIKSMIYG